MPYRINNFSNSTEENLTDKLLDMIEKFDFTNDVDGWRYIEYSQPFDYDTKLLTLTFSPRQYITLKPNILFCKLGDLFSTPLVLHNKDLSTGYIDNHQVIIYTKKQKERVKKLLRKIKIQKKELKKRQEWESKRQKKDNINKWKHRSTTAIKELLEKQNV